MVVAEALLGSTAYSVIGLKYAQVYGRAACCHHSQSRREPARAPGQTTFRAPPHPLPFPLPSLPPPSQPPLLFLPSLPLEVGPLNPARGSGPQPKLNLVHFRLKI